MIKLVPSTPAGVEDCVGAVDLVQQFLGQVGNGGFAAMVVVLIVALSVLPRRAANAIVFLAMIGGSQVMGHWLNEEEPDADSLD